MNILLIRLRMIGDVVFTTPAIRALRRRYPDARHHVTWSKTRPRRSSQGNPHLDDVIVVPLTTRPRVESATTGASARDLGAGGSIW